MPPSLPPFLPPCRAVETRITQEALRRHVLRVLRTWRERYVFSDDYLNGLQVWTRVWDQSQHIMCRLVFFFFGLLALVCLQTVSTIQPTIMGNHMAVQETSTFHSES